MATKKQTKWWYVLVLTDEGPKFVTSVGSDNTANWDKVGTPYEMSENWAKSISLGLTWNGWTAFAICSSYEITYQPYRYSNGHFEWVKENKDESVEC